MTLVICECHITRPDRSGLQALLDPSPRELSGIAHAFLVVLGRRITFLGPLHQTDDQPAWVSQENCILGHRNSLYELYHIKYIYYRINL